MSERPSGELIHEAAAPPESVDELYEDAPVGYLSTSPDGTIVRANRTFLAMAGYDATHLVGRRRFYDLLPPGAKIYYETHYAPLLEMQRAVREIALELVRADGTRLPILVNAHAARSDDGQTSSIRITVFDATHRRQYERELLAARAAAESRAAAASALRHVQEAVVVLDPDGRVTVTNPAAHRLLRLPDDAVGFALAAMVPGWGAVGPRIPVGRAGEPPEPAVVPLADRWVAAAGESSPDGVVYTLRDVTSERRLNELRDDIIAVVSHELRTPLTGLYGAAQTLAAHGDALPAESRTALLEMLLEQSGRLKRILDEMHFTQQLDNDELAVEATSFSVGGIVERVVERSRRWRSSHTIELSLGETTEALGDPHLFDQVVVNLLDNAFKYSPDETAVRVAVEQHRASVRVTVTDAGPGIAAEDADRIFDKFFRVDPAQASGTAGTGLGLYISRELVRRMNGRIGLLESDRGATFFVDLPAAR